MRIGMVSAINFMSENKSQNLNNSKIELIKVNKDRIPYKDIESIVNAQGLTLKISKGSTIIDSKPFSVFTLTGTKKFPVLDPELTSKVIFKLPSDAASNVIQSKFAKALEKIINGLYDKCSSLLAAKHKLESFHK